MELEDDVLVLWENDGSLLDDSVLETYSNHQKSEILSPKEETLYRQISEDLDYALALSLQTQYDDEVNENKGINSKDEVSLLDNTSLEAYSNDQKSERLSSKDETFLKQIDEDLDYAFATSLQTQYDYEVKQIPDVYSEISSKESKPISIVDEQWELIDPHPDIHALFLGYDDKYFYGKLKSVEVKWSPRMTLCAGVCSYEGRAGYCSIRLSEPLLKLRPRKDLVETLLHEMIHAYLFVTQNNKDREGHGPEFLSHMNRINKEAGTKISVYHSFHDEVDLYRKHWWKCDGPCQNRRPFYGIVKRAMNRAPGPNDNWWTQHQANCGGKFTKIKEPDDYNKKKVAKRKYPSVAEGKGSDIRSFLNDTGRTSSSSHSNSASKSPSIFDLKSILPKEENVASVNHSNAKKNNFVPFQGVGVKLGSSTTPVKSSNKDSVPRKKDWDWCAIPSTSSGKIAAKSSKIPQLPKFRKNEHVPKGQSTVIPFSVPKKLVQSPIESFLTSRAGTSGEQQNQNLPNVCKKRKNLYTSRMYCPVCLLELFTEQDIDIHTTQCLIKSELPS